MSLFKLNLLGATVLFAHIPRTGGTSIRDGRQLSSHLIYNPDDSWTRLPSLAFVREPFDRLVSCWLDFRFNRGLVEWTFSEFLRQVTRDGVGRSSIGNPASIEHYAAPMTHPVHGLRHVRFVGRYESLQRDFNTFTRELGVEDIRLPRLRRSPKWDGPMLNTPENVRLVYTKYKDDYELYESVRS